MEEIILYTTHCPKCRVLETKLQRKQIAYRECTDIEEMKSLGIQSVPQLKVRNELMDFVQANAFINTL